MKATKITILTLLIMITTMLILVACKDMNNTTSVNFPNIDNSDIPDILEKTVGTLGNTYYTSFGANDKNDYQSLFALTFKNTTKADYTNLMEHYQSTSTGTYETGSLLFDWGRLQVTTDNDLIIINAYIK